jgi:pyruvate dehydrogenase E1 component
LLAKDFGVSSDIWSVTSFTQLRRDGLEADRWNMLHPEAEPRISYVEKCLGKGVGPVVAATDYMKVVADGIRPFVPARFKALGTDGFGRSDYRRRLRSFFEVDRYHVAVAALKALADDQLLPSKTVAEAIKLYKIDTERASPALS